MLKKINKILSGAKTRKRFFDRIGVYLPSRDSRFRMIEKAYDISEDVTSGHKRDSGERVFEHMLATALIVVEYLRVKSPNLIVAALIHDLNEDSPSWTINRIESEFNEKVADLLEWLSKPSMKYYKTKDERNFIYHQRFASAPRDFFLVKLPDRLHNILTLHARSRDKQIKKINETKVHYLSYVEREFILYHELLDGMAMVERNLVKN